MKNIPYRPFWKNYMKIQKNGFAVRGGGGLVAQNIKDWSATFRSFLRLP